MPTQPTANPWREYWSLDPDVTYLNHGSFGACPWSVLTVQQALRQQLERQPMDFLGRESESRLDQARSALAAFLGAAATDLVFVPNATTGVNAVLRSLRFQPGEQLLVTNHGYNACRNALNFVAERWGAEVVVVEVPFPLTDMEAMVQPILAAVTPRTRLALLDHVSSQTGLVWPLSTIIPALSVQGVETLIDGAHAAGMIPLNLSELGATYYTGNCHKWLCAPKGAGFLYVQPSRQVDIRPLTISHGANDPRINNPVAGRSRFWLEFDWTGTDDPTAYLAVPAALEFLAQLLPGGWPALMQRNHELVVAARQLLSEQLQIPLPCPDEFLGSLASIPLTDAPEGELPCELQNQLRQLHIEVPVFPWPAPPRRLIRISAAAYNTLADYEHLAEVLGKLQEV